MANIDELKRFKDEAWAEFERLDAPAKKAYKKYQAASVAYQEAVLYAKARRAVMRELLNQAEKAGGIQATEYHWPRLRNLPEPERSLFKAALAGKTVPVVDGVPAEEQDFYYRHDYDRWKAGLPPLD